MALGGIRYHCCCAARCAVGAGIRTIHMTSGLSWPSVSVHPSSPVPATNGMQDVVFASVLPSGSTSTWHKFSHRGRGKCGYHRVWAMWRSKISSSSSGPSLRLPPRSPESAASASIASLHFSMAETLHRSCSPRRRRSRWSCACQDGRRILTSPSPHGSSRSPAAQEGHIAAVGTCRPRGAVILPSYSKSHALRGMRCAARGAHGGDEILLSSMPGADASRGVYADGRKGRLFACLPTPSVGAYRRPSWRD
ncbi:hypothetical protein B0H13DRAFT_2674474 [Mycena leptocephala]|nr:hypothetical protein B0H13DRAFT_2674474 [Mycena leptocephala]